MSLWLHTYGAPLEQPHVVKTQPNPNIIYENPTPTTPAKTPRVLTHSTPEAADSSSWFLLMPGSQWEWLVGFNEFSCYLSS